MAEASLTRRLMVSPLSDRIPTLCGPMLPDPPYSSARKRQKPEGTGHMQSSVKVCKLAIVIQYMLRILWFKEKLVSLSNDNVDVMNGNRKFGS